MARSPLSPPSEGPRLSDPSVTSKLRWFASRAEQAIFVGGADGLVEWANDAACRLCGARLEQLVGRRVRIFPGDAEAQREAEEHVARRIAAGESAHLEAALRDREGRSRWIELQVTPVPGEAGEGAGWVAVADDVTARRRAAAEMAEREERYRSLVEGSPEPVAVHSEGQLVYANRAALELLGASSHEQVLGRPVLDFLHPDYHGLAAERMRKMEAAGDPAEPLVETLIRVDGSPVDVRLAATPITWRGAPAIQLAGHALGDGGDAAPAQRPLLDLSTLVLDLAPHVEGRIAPRAIVSFDLTGALLAVPGEAAALAQLVRDVVGQAAVVLPGGRGGLLLRTAAFDLSTPEAALFAPEGSVGSGPHLLLEARASAGSLGGDEHEALLDPSFAERFPGRGPGLAGALAIARAHAGGIRVRAGTEGGLAIAVALPAARRHAARSRRSPARAQRAKAVDRAPSA